MKYTLAAAFALAASSFASAQGVTAVISPPAPAPSGCATTYTGNFEINAQNVSTSAKRGLFEKRVTECGSAGTLVINLCNGVLHDELGRTGYIASNRQFQFDGPPQAGAIYTSGFSVCANGTLALGGSAVFYQCLSGTFFNLYDQSQGGQCSPAYIDIIPCTNGTTPTCGAASATVSSAVVSSTSSSSSTSTSSKSSSSSIFVANSTTTSTTLSSTILSITTTITSTPSVASSAVAQITDGQPQATTATSSALPVQTKNAGSILGAGQEFAALVAGVAALVMI